MILRIVRQPAVAAVERQTMMRGFLAAIFAVEDSAGVN